MTLSDALWDTILILLECVLNFLRSLLLKGIPFVWTSNYEVEFQDLKTALVSPNLMLYHPDFDKPFEVHTDVSKYGTGAMLAQWHDNELGPIRYVYDQNF